MPLLRFLPLRAAVRRASALAFCAAVLLVLAFSTGPAFGQAASTPTTPGEDAPLGPATTAAGEGGGDAATATDGGSSGGLVRTIVGLLIVIAVIYGVTWVLKQIKARDEDDAVGAGLESRATLPLGPGRSVHLVRAGTEYLLLGVTDGGVQALRTYSEAEARAAGFPIDEVDALPVLKDRSEGPTTLVERIRDLTVRR